MIGNGERAVVWMDKKNLLLAFASLAVMFLLAEAVTRLVYYPESLGVVIGFDDALGWSLVPGSHMRSVDYGKGFDYLVEVNSLGLRDREIPEKRESGKKRILILGDSVAFGIGLDYGDRFSDIMQRALGDDVEVLNAGVPGWGNDQELLYYERKGRNLHPDLVILTLTLSNDVLNNMLDHLYLGASPKPRFVIRSDSLFLTKAKLARPEPRNAPRAKAILKKSRFLVFVKRRIDRWRAERREVGSGLPPGFAGHYFERHYSYWTVYEKAYPDRFAEAWKVTEAVILRLNAECTRDGAKLVVFALPTKLEVDEDWKSSLLKESGIDSGLLDFSAPYRRLNDFLALHEIPFAYPLGVFKKVSKSFPLYFASDPHPDRRGHALAAWALLELLGSRYGLEADLDRALGMDSFAAVVGALKERSGN